MEHFYKNIYGHFDFEVMYSKMVNESPVDAHFIEVGAFYGKSAAYMAVEIINSGKNIKFDVVDTWRGSPEHQEGAWDAQVHMIQDTAFDVFQSNLSPVKGHYTPLKMPSVEAAKLYQDKSLDFVYIDASHEYEFIKEDIIAWLPKIKIGGYIGGHDYWPDNAMFKGIPVAIKEIIGDDIDLITSSITSSWFHKVKQ